MDWKKTLLTCLIILLGGAVVTALIFSTEPTASRSGATKETAMLVNVTQVEKGTYQPTIKVMGTVQPSQDVMLSPRVSGEIINRGDAFTPGGYVQKGEMLLQIDPTDYKNALQQRKSELQQAISDLNIEMGRQNVALQDYQLVEDSLSEENKALVLREPQLEAAKSNVQSARAAVKQAELDLQRTTIRAPFDAHILSRNANIGSQVATGSNLGRLVGLDTYWIEATVPLSQLRWLSFPQDGEEGSEVSIQNRTAWDPNTYRTGELYRLVGNLESETRMARVLISVTDPQAMNPENEGKPSLIIGAFVEASVKAKELTDVVKLSRDYLRQNETVWVMEEGTLQIKDVDILLRDAQHVYITEGLNDQAQVVTTNLSTVTDGAPLRLEGDDSTTAADTMSQE
ncbi:efflux RND transporter periplasmic adaptor subunit [Fodinibius salsisoli]|uniref:Efflux RND transporter periplasmic adaptor subunit n=1 Tax=Fodinibius salsisoli TaxID=2820877 RepID=A0ABT3PKC9_9BACT|nr:efflux RND transporter periplasmic adaptor subunit [Fodinibius salsisoli]MCW9706400.1 efflux RND transporter periplasmic adaptor subunit [Fodinibius salsisoli]